MPEIEHGVDLYGEGAGSEKRAVVREEFGDFFTGRDDQLKDDCAALLRYLKRLSIGHEDPASDARERVEALGEALYCRVCGGLVGFYAIDGPAGRVQRLVTVLRVARAQSAQPSVKNLELAKMRLTLWRRQG